MDRKLADLETLFKALADETRLRILGLLLTGDVCVCHIHESLRIPQSKASRHLAYLRRSGLVDTRRDGLWVYYRIARQSDAVLGSVHQAIIHVLSHVDAVKRDTDRLQKKTGCCAPASIEMPACACCAPQASDDMSPAAPERCCS